ESGGRVASGRKEFRRLFRGSTLRGFHRCIQRSQRIRSSLKNCQLGRKLETRSIETRFSLPQWLLIRNIPVGEAAALEPVPSPADKTSPCQRCQECGWSPLGRSP